jgi:hypothetical protein
LNKVLDKSDFLLSGLGTDLVYILILHLPRKGLLYGLAPVLNIHEYRHFLVYILDFQGRVTCQVLLALGEAGLNHELIRTGRIFHGYVVFDDVPLSLLGEGADRHHSVVLLWQLEELKHITLLLLTVLTLQHSVEICERAIYHLWVLRGAEHVTLSVLYFDGLIYQGSIETILWELFAHLSEEIISCL